MDGQVSSPVCPGLVMSRGLVCRFSRFRMQRSPKVPSHSFQGIGLCAVLLCNAEQGGNFYLIWLVQCVNACSLPCDAIPGPLNLRLRALEWHFTGGVRNCDVIVVPGSEKPDHPVRDLGRDSFDNPERAKAKADLPCPFSEPATARALAGAGVHD